MTETIDNSQWPLNSLLVLHRHHVIYTPIAKNANTTLKRLLVRLSGHPESARILSEDVHSFLANHPTGLSLGDYTAEQATEILEDERFFRFTVLRNPLKRAASAYLEKFVTSPPAIERGNPLFGIINPVIDSVYEDEGKTADYSRSITFNQFVQYVSKHKDRALDTHFKSQAAFLENQRFDYLAALENFGQLIEVLNARFKQEIEPEWINRSAPRKPLFRRRNQANLLPAQLRAQRNLPHSSELLTDPLKAKLKSRYAGDFKLWRTALEGN